MSSPVDRNKSSVDLTSALNYIDPNNPLDPNSPAYVDPNEDDSSQVSDDSSPADQAAKDISRSLRNFGKVQGFGG